MEFVALLSEQKWSKLITGLTRTRMNTFKCVIATPWWGVPGHHQELNSSVPLATWLTGCFARFQFFWADPTEPVDQMLTDFNWQYLSAGWTSRLRCAVKMALLFSVWQNYMKTHTTLAMNDQSMKYMGHSISIAIPVRQTQPLFPFLCFGALRKDVTVHPQRDKKNKDPQHDRTLRRTSASHILRHPFIAFFSQPQ